MQFSFTSIPYTETGYFTDLICDYLRKDPFLEPFYRHPVSVDGIRQSIREHESFPQNREVLVQHLLNQYQDMPDADEIRDRIESLRSSRVFTITTAHQPALFTGNLYFIYKILHCIRLAAQCKADFPEYDFVPVYWMGSEDADLDELGKIYLNGEWLKWDAGQTGAVGRMKPEGLDKMLARIEGEMGVQPHGKELMALLKECYLQSPDIQTATFRLLHQLFRQYGLVTIIPDSAALKALMIPVFEADLFRQEPAAVVEKTIARLSVRHKIQAQPRPVNLFYLLGDSRERIIPEEQGFRAGERFFSAAEIREELRNFPDRFSPNVILRGLFQETVLPNLAFIGGGGETAYWLELEEMFRHYGVPFPVLVLRNSFLLVEKKWMGKIRQTGFLAQDFFQSEQSLLKRLVESSQGEKLHLKEELEKIDELYQQMGDKAAAIDASLRPHAESLQARARKPLLELEKKMIRAEKRKHETDLHRIKAIHGALFPQGGLQERVENFIPFYARWGQAFLEKIYAHSFSLEQAFAILSEE